MHNLFSQQITYTPTLPGLSNSPFPYVASNEVGIPNEKLELLRQELISWAENGDVVGNEILMIKDGKIFFHETYGWADIATKKPLARNMIWNIRSMTKPLTATAIMLLVEEGELSLDDQVIKYIPDYKGNPNTTIGHLISHTSGYSRQDFDDYDDSVATLKDWLMLGALKEPTGNYGEYEYTDFGFVASAYIIEKITGESYKKFIDQKIIQPLGLENTRVNFSDEPEWRSRISTWYLYNQDKGEYELNWPTDREGWHIVGGAWGMFSTALDYAAFLSCFENNGKWNQLQLLKEDNIKLMRSPRGYANDIPIYGYGWMLQTSNKVPNSILSYGHRGGDALAGYVFPNEDLIIIYMSHSRGGNHREAFMEKLNELDLVQFTTNAGQPIRPDKYQGDFAKLSESDLKRFSGSFKDSRDNGELCDIINNKDHLTLNLYSNGQLTKQSLDLVYLGDNRFAIADYLNDELDWLNPEAIIHFSDSDENLNSFEFKYRERLILKAIKKE